MSPVTIILADSDVLLECAYRFRYDVYVKGMGRRQIYADHAGERIVEPQDEHGRTHIALDQHGHVVATVRSNRADDPAMLYYRSVYKLGLFDFPDLSKIQITTKLIVHPDHRNTPITYRLIRDFAVDGYRRGVQVNFIDCNRHLIPFFERLGYFSYCGWRFHKEYGSVMPMFHAVDAVSYLEQTGSFLWKAAAEHLKDNQFGGYDLIRRFATRPKALCTRVSSVPDRVAS
ncbi:N-acyl amino acid synthase FeeM domain-containing protein [Aquibium microcysteis]|uniref:N-acyl amino acid synthase FeeM domain-containing protein n=1 Tax=Aquibium microcysteis TaxID=675281 RepID=UPI001AEEA711|nr:GNAT family N-acyltransferase [Aquibium microcysteis]